MCSPLDHLTPDLSLTWHTRQRCFLPSTVEDGRFLKVLGWKWGEAFTAEEKPGRFSLDYLMQFLAVKGEEVTIETRGYEE